MEHVLTLEEIGYWRDDDPILSGITVDIKAGENFAIIGPNGAGKSVLVAIIAGYMWPTTGQVTVLGKRYGRVNLFDVRRDLGIISMSRIPEFPGHMRVREVAATGLFGTIVIPNGVTIRESDWAKVDEELDFVGMATMGRKRIDTLSTGEIMRVMIARAIVSDPKLLIFDEPCSGLDMKARAMVVSVMDQVRQRVNSPTIIIVTHHLEELPTQVDKVLLIKKGRTVAYGGCDEVITSKLFSEAFDCDVTIEKQQGRYYSRVTWAE